MRWRNPLKIQKSPLSEYRRSNSTQGALLVTDAAGMVAFKNTRTRWGQSMKVVLYDEVENVLQALYPTRSTP
jgi:hypothetical protein